MHRVTHESVHETPRDARTAHPPGRRHENTSHTTALQGGASPRAHKDDRLAGEEALDGGGDRGGDVRRATRAVASSSCRFMSCAVASWPPSTQMVCLRTRACT